LLLLAFDISIANSLSESLELVSNPRQRWAKEKSDPLNSFRSSVSILQSTREVDVVYYRQSVGLDNKTKEAPYWLT